MRVQRIFAAVVASLAVSACYTQRVMTASEITAQAPHEVTIVRQNTTITKVYMPSLQDGTIVGRSSGAECLLASCRKPDVSVPVSDVKEVRTKTLNKGATYGLVAVGVAGVFALAIGLKGNGADMGCQVNCSTQRAGASIPTAAIISTVSRFTHGLTAALR
jgi:hypothetical protein